MKGLAKGTFVYLGKGKEPYQITDVTPCGYWVTDPYADSGIGYKKRKAERFVHPIEDKAQVALLFQHTEEMNSLWEKGKTLKAGDYAVAFGRFARISKEEDGRFYMDDDTICDKSMVRAPSNAELSNGIWLRERQEKLRGVKIRYYESEINKAEREALENAGYYVWTMRAWDEGDGYNIETFAIANRIGNWVTEIDLKPYLNDGDWIGTDELKYADLEEIPYKELEPVFLGLRRKLYANV